MTASTLCIVLCIIALILLNRRERREAEQRDRELEARNRGE